MSEDKTPHTKLTRRGFLKASGAIGAAAALSGTVSVAGMALADGGLSQGGNEQTFVGQCRGNCFSGCPLKVKVRDGKLVHTEHLPYPVPEYNRLCAKGYGHPQRTYSPKRLQYPMRLVGERGSGQWERITWEEAIDEICTKWKQYQAESGDTSILKNVGSCSGFKTLGMYDVLFQYMGGSSIQFGYDAAGCVALEKVIGFTETLAGNTAASSHPHAKTILMMGTNAAVAQPNTFHFLQEAQSKGGKLIHIDPVYGLTSAKCDQYVRIRPATDAALLLGMIREVIEQGWIDEDYLITATVAPYLVKESDGKFLRGSDLGIAPIEGAPDATGQATMVDRIVVWDSAKDAYGLVGEVATPALAGTYEVNGIKVSTAYQLLVEETREWTLEKASELTEIPAEVIADLTKRFAEDTPSEIYMCYGLNQYNEGHRPYHAALTLLALTGNFGKVGAGFGGLEAAIGMGFYSLPQMMIADAKPSGPVVSAAALGTVLDEKKLGDIPLDARSVFVYAHNPVANMTDRLSTIETYRKFDLVVVADMWMTDTIEQCADIVLPVCGWFEHVDVIGGVAAPFIRLQEKAIEPLFDSRDDYEIGRMLMDGMGFADKFTYTLEEYLADTMNNPTAAEMGISWDRLLDEKVIYYGEFIHGENGEFTTPTGKFEFYVENWTRSSIWEGNDLGLPIDKESNHLPHFAVPHEAWPETVGGYEMNPLAEKYPLIFTSIRNRYTTHSMYADVDWFREQVSEPTIRLSPKDAEERGIQGGDYVRAFNDRGDVVMKAEIHNGIRPGMVVYPKGWQNGDFKHGHIANLTSSWMTSAAYNFYFYDVLCEVEKWEGSVE